jgi:hypothetical protein
MGGRALGGKPADDARDPPFRDAKEFKMTNTSCTIRTRKFMTNPLLQRRQFVRRTMRADARMGAWARTTMGAHDRVHLTWKRRRRDAMDDDDE